jgi:alanyl-tRNA synthetase
VHRTGQIGMIPLRGCTKVRQDWRVEFVAGGRAEAVARENTGTLSRLAAQLGCAQEDVGPSVDRLLREREAASKRNRILLSRLAEAEASARLAALAPRPDGVRLVAEVLEDAAPDYLQLLATALARGQNAVALLAGRETGGLVLAQAAGAGKDMNELLKSVLDQLGGRGGGTRDFARGALADPSLASEAIDLARRLL